MITRADIEYALSLPCEENAEGMETFEPWGHVISGIYGGYSSQSDKLMIQAMEAVRDGKPFEFIDAEGFAGEFALYVLAGHGLTEYGTSPRGAWVDFAIKDLWKPLIDKWKCYYKAHWGEDYDAP